MTNGKGFWCPILDNPLEPYQDEKIIKYLEGGRPFPNFLGAAKVEKIQKVPEIVKKCHFVRCRIMTIHDMSWYKHYN